jgi:hypothetical protein
MSGRAKRAQAVADAAQQAESRAAIARILADARRNRRSDWNAGTIPLPMVNRPLMTPGGQHRTRRNRRR